MSELTPGAERSFGRIPCYEEVFSQQFGGSDTLYVDSRHFGCAELKRKYNLEWDRG